MWPTHGGCYGYAVVVTHGSVYGCLDGMRQNRGSGHGYPVPMWLIHGGCYGYGGYAVENEEPGHGCPTAVTAHGFGFGSDYGCRSRCLKMSWNPLKRFWKISHASPKSPGVS